MRRAPAAKKKYRKDTDRRGYRVLIVFCKLPTVVYIHASILGCSLDQGRLLLARAEVRSPQIG